MANVTELELVKILGHAVEFKDEATGYHVVRVSHYVYILARHLGIKHNDAVTMARASMLHDVGKIGIPDSILQKPSKLTPAERAIIEQHCVIGAAIIGEHDNPLLKTAREIALYHHERWDGTGYPHKLAGENIPLSARITAVADVFDAMTGPRPYRVSCTITRTLDYITENAEKHFDSRVVDALHATIDKFVHVRLHYATLAFADSLDALEKYNTK